jgi:hypothetical protein
MIPRLTHAELEQVGPFLERIKTHKNAGRRVGAAELEGIASDAIKLAKRWSLVTSSASGGWGLTNAGANYLSLYLELFPPVDVESLAELEVTA